MYPRGLILRKGNSPNLDETEGFQSLAHLNWSVCSFLSKFCSDNFLFVSPLYWKANSYYPRVPRGLILRKEILPTSQMYETEGFQCLVQSDWTICSPLSQFCSDNFWFVSPLYKEANSYYPRGLILRKGNSPNFRNGWDRGISVPGSLKPIKPIICPILITPGG